MTMSNTSLYIHIPFCKRKCAYCAFFSLCGSPNSLIDDYFAALKAQISLLPPQKFSTVYFGGGTPTFAGASRCAGLLEHIYMTHSVDNDAEITIEANPGTVDHEAFCTLKAAGFNRLSLGLQSASDKVLSAMGRAHTVGDFNDAYNSALAAGFTNISVDMIFGLPKEFGDGLDDTVRLIKALDPQHISAYSLSVEPKTKLFQKKDVLTFPTEDEEEEQYKFICDSFSGYEHYEISSFAKLGYRSRHNSAYWKLTPYLGIGAAAHSFYENKRFSYPSDVKGFIECAGKPFGNSDFFSAIPESSAELDEDRIMLGLRTSDGAVLNGSQIKKAATAVKAGLAELIGDRLILNSAGYRVSNEIIAEILA